MSKVFQIIALALVLLTAGCSSVPKMMGALPGRDYEVVGKATGSAGGFMLFQIIPIMHNSKIQRAYDEAVYSRNGDDLINVRIRENWFWAYIGNGYRTTIEGDVIKYKN